MLGIQSDPILIPNRASASALMLKIAMAQSQEKKKRSWLRSSEHTETKPVSAKSVSLRVEYDSSNTRLFSRDLIPPV